MLLRAIFPALALILPLAPLEAATIKPVSATARSGTPQNTIDGEPGNWWQSSQGETIVWHFDGPQTIGGFYLEAYDEYSYTFLGSFTARFLAGETLVRTYRRRFLPDGDGGSTYWPRMGFGSGIVLHGVTRVEFTLGGAIDVTNPDFGNSGSTGIGEIAFYATPVPLAPGLVLTASALALLGGVSRLGSRRARQG